MTMCKPVDKREKPELHYKDKILMETAARIQAWGNSLILVDILLAFNRKSFNRVLSIQKRYEYPLCDVPTMPGCSGELRGIEKEGDRMRLTFAVKCEQVLAYFKDQGFEPEWELNQPEGV